MTGALTRLLPHDLDAEASVLSALMIDPARILDVDRLLAPSDFYSVANRLIASAIWELDASGKAIDSVAVASRLLAHEQLGQIGGTPYLAQITDAIPAVANVAQHAQVVADAARIRRVIGACQVTAAGGYAALADAPEWLSGASATLFEACEAERGGPDSVSVVSDTVPAEYAALVERSRSRSIPGRPTRIHALDQILGGLIDGVAYVVAGRPSHGKTALAWQIAEGIAAGGALAIFLSQEMPRPQLIQRAIAQASNVEVRSLQHGRLTDSEWTSVARGIEFVQDLPIAVDDRAGHTPHTLRSSVRRCLQRLHAKGHTGPLGVIVLDYLQIMATRPGRESRSTEVGDNMHAVTALAREFRCPVVVLSQLNREIERRPIKRPLLSDLGESGAIEADAYGIVFVYREDVYRKEGKDGKADLIVAKNRNGRTGTATMRYLPSTLFAPGLQPSDEFDGFADDARYAGDAA